MTKDELIKQIHTAFKDVQLEEGIGLWEAQGLDDYADQKTMLELKRKDERYNWDNISFEDLNDCQSSLSFFDAKGMRFCLPKFLIFDIVENQSSVLFTLSHNLSGVYQQNRFSLLNSRQIQCIIYFLEYKIQEVVERYKAYAMDYGSSMESLYSDSDYIELNRALNEWKLKFE